LRVPLIYTAIAAERAAAGRAADSAEREA